MRDGETNVTPRSSACVYLAQMATGPEVLMRREVVLLKAVEGTREGWLVMERDEFLEQLDLESWSAEQVLIGTLLPADPQPKAN